MGRERLSCCSALFKTENSELGHYQKTRTFTKTMKGAALRSGRRLLRGSKYKALLIALGTETGCETVSNLTYSAPFRYLFDTLVPHHYMHSIRVSDLTIVFSS